MAKPKPKLIRPSKGKLCNYEIATFDIETKPVDGESALLAPYCLGATCLDGTDKTIKYHYYPLTLLQYIISKGDSYRWYCHNGGGFDFKYILADKPCQEWILSQGWEVSIIGGKIVKALMFRKGKKTILVCDSFKIMPSSLAKLSKALDVETAKGFIDFDTEEFDPTNPIHLEYLRDDCISLWQVVQKYRDIINDQFGTEMKCTASSTAFSCFLTTLDAPIFHNSKMVNSFARKSYYGGRTECFYQNRIQSAIYIDVNSLYAYIMYNCGMLRKPFYTKEYAGNGFYYVKACVPEGIKFCPLPYRKPDNTGVLFPCGEFKTFVSSEEIEIARSQGCMVDIIEGYGFDEHDRDVFKPFITKCMELRAVDYNGPLGIAAKFLQNNLYGFFGMNPLRDETILSPFQPDEADGFSPIIDEITGLMIPGLWEREKYEETQNCIPAIAAWITANARAYLLRAMIAEEKAGNKVLYCDTDSIIMQGIPVSPIADGEYGKFKVEYIIDEFIGITGKTYRFTDDKQKDVLKCKGIPQKKLTAEMFDLTLAGVKQTREFVQLNSLSRVLKTGLLGNEHATRTMPNPHSITTRVPHEDGFTRPIKLG
jgi:hypothetical protein